MKKKLALIVSVLCCLSLLSGCGEKEVVNNHPDIDPEAYIANNVCSMTETQVKKFAKGWEFVDKSQAYVKSGINYAGLKGTAMILIKDGKVYAASYIVDTSVSGQTNDAVTDAASTNYKAIVEVYGKQDNYSGDALKGTASYTWLAKEGLPTVATSVNLLDNVSFTVSFMDLSE